MKQRTSRKTRLTISEARAEISRLPDNIEPTGPAITVTRYGKPVLAILPWAAYEDLLALQETLEVLADEELMAAIRRSKDEFDDGKGIPWEEAKARLSQSRTA